MAATLSPAPPPPEPVGKPKDVSFDRESTMMRVILKQGHGPEARDGSSVTVHFKASRPGADGKLVEFFSTEATRPEGIRFTIGRTTYCEAVERGLYACQPGAVLDVFCTEVEGARCHEMGIDAHRIPETARDVWASPSGPIGVLQGTQNPPPMIAPKPEDELPPWQPPRYLTVFRVLLDSVSGGAVPMLMLPDERLSWCLEMKSFATDLFRRGMHARAMRRYKKTMLDLEVPCRWDEEQNIARNQLRLQCHLNVAACGLRFPPRPWEHPNLSSRKRTFDPLQEAAFHCTRALAVDSGSVKALFRRAQAHLKRDPAEHINGLQLALEDLCRAAELEPQNGEVRRELARARQLQKEADGRAAGVYTKMLGNANGELI